MTQYMQHTHEAVAEFIECKMSQGSRRNLFTALLQSHDTAWHAVKHCNVKVPLKSKCFSIFWTSVSDYVLTIQDNHSTIRSTTR